MKKLTITIATLICCFAVGFISTVLSDNVEAGISDAKYKYYCTGDTPYNCTYYPGPWCGRDGYCGKPCPDGGENLRTVCYEGVWIVSLPDGTVYTSFYSSDPVYTCECTPNVHPHDPTGEDN